MKSTLFCFFVIISVIAVFGQACNPNLPQDCPPCTVLSDQQCQSQTGFIFSYFDVAICDCLDCPPCKNGTRVREDGRCVCSDCSGYWSGVLCDQCIMTCPQNQTLEPTSCTCVGACSPDTCSINQDFDPSKCKCNCKSHWEGTNCDQCISRTCGNGSYLDSTTCSCKPCGNTCLIGQGSIVSNGIDQNTCNCACNGGWEEDQCQTCNLSCKNNSSPNRQCTSCTCPIDGPFTGQLCDVCLPNQGTKGCQSFALMGSVVFIISPTTSSFITTSDNNNWSQIISTKGYNALIDDMAKSLGVENNLVSIYSISQQKAQKFEKSLQKQKSSLQSLQTPTQPGTQTTVTYAINAGNDQQSFDALTKAWEDMKNNFSSKPISSTEATTEIGPPQQVSDPIIPQIEAAPRISSLGLILGLTIGLGVGLIVCVTLVCVLLWCRKKQRGLWKPKKEQDKDELSSYLPQKGSKAASKGNNNTSLTLDDNATKNKTNNNQGVELSINPAGSEVDTRTQSIHTVNDHNEVKDPTLPANIKAYRNNKGDVYYVDSETMTTSWTHPTGAKPDHSAPGYGSDW